MLAFDHSPHSLEALNIVLDRAWDPGTWIKLVCVVPHEGGVLDSLLALFGQDGHEEKSIDSLRQLVDRIARDAASALSEVSVTADVLEGDTVDVLMAFESTFHADLIVAGSRSKSMREDMGLGSVSQAILDRAECPVLIARRKYAPTESRGENILVAMDDSPEGASAAEWIMQQSWIRGKNIGLFSAIEPLGEAYVRRNVVSASRELLAWQQEKSLREGILRQYEHLIREHCQVQSVKSGVAEGDIVELILRGVKTWPADLVVMGSRSRSALQRTVLGSVSRKVSMHAECSVEVVKGCESRNYARIRQYVLDKSTLDELLMETPQPQKNRPSGGVESDIHYFPPGL